MMAGHVVGCGVCRVGFCQGVWIRWDCRHKIEEYLGMFQLSGWSGLSMLLSVLLCAAELTLGLLLLLRLWRKLTAVVVDTFYTWIYDSYLFDLYGSLWWYK